jgi:hypothetical protein
MLRLSFRPGAFITLVFLAVFLLATIHGWEWSYIAKLMPVYLVGIPGIVFSLVQLYRDLTRWEERKGGSRGGVEMDEVFRGGLYIWTEIARTFTFFGWFAGGAMAIWLLGIIIALPLLVFLYAIIEGREKLPTSLLLGGGSFLFLWGLFEYGLGIQWPPGALFR